MDDLEAAATASNDMLAGNVLRKSDKPVSLAATLGNAEESKDGIDNQSGTKYSNSLKGICGEDTLAGDVLAVAAGNITLSALVGKGGEVSGYYGPVEAGKGGEDNRLFAFNDRASGGGGKDVVAGDVHSTKQGNIGITVDVGRGGRGSYLEEGGPAGSGNAAIAFNDRLFGGSGDDFLSGDVYRVTAIGPISLVVAAGPGADGGWRQFCADGGAKNSADSSNDQLIGDDGDDTLVGDVFAMIDSGVITLRAVAGGGGSGYTNGAGGPDNRVSAFNDAMGGGSGEDVLVGDVYRLYSHDRLELAANAGNGGHGGYGHVAGSIGGAGGDTNVARAGNDVLRGGADADALVGDVAHVSSSGAVLLTAEAGNGEDWGQGSGGKGGGNNNVDAFNDALFGGFGADILAGDVRSNDDAGEIALRATAGAGGNGGEFDIRRQRREQQPRNRFRGHTAWRCGRG